MDPLVSTWAAKRPFIWSSRLSFPGYSHVVPSCVFAERTSWKRLAGIPGRLSSPSASSYACWGSVGTRSSFRRGGRRTAFLEDLQNTGRWIEAGWTLTNENKTARTMCKRINAHAWCRGKEVKTRGGGTRQIKPAAKAYIGNSSGLFVCLLGF